MAALLESVEARNSSCEFIIQSLEEKLCELEEIATLVEEKERQATQTVWMKSVCLFL